ncbi:MULTISPECIES: hypothetical protein [Actinoplanes]|uniref:Uncharacterized protein n=1 Tax=Actinoplanes palleronii TaxID=113570 RepID=A0ABQ4B3F5_9ACTN|nr:MULTISPECIES: hypothetical protein [Actinoplanes]GIE65204.1 hypothetical protein Apa02nite_013120 [Actinoplanes palleronii]
MLAQFPKPLTPMPSREPFGSDLSRTPPAMVPVLALALLLSAVLVGLVTVALP